MACSSIAALAAVRPLTQFTRIAASASAQLGSDDSPPRFSLLAAVRAANESRCGGAHDRLHCARCGRSPSSLCVEQEGRAPNGRRHLGGAWRSGAPSQCENVSRGARRRAGTPWRRSIYRHAPQFQYPRNSRCPTLARAIARQLGGVGTRSAPDGCFSSSSGDISRADGVRSRRPAGASRHRDLRAARPPRGISGPAVAGPDRRSQRAAHFSRRDAGQSTRTVSRCLAIYLRRAGPAAHTAAPSGEGITSSKPSFNRGAASDCAR